MFNPYYDPSKLDLKLISYDEPDMCHEYNTLCFWATEDGRVYSASDSGCSCPTPFEDYSGETQKEALQKMERVSSAYHAESIFNSWNKNYDGKPFLPSSEKRELTEWISKELKI